MEYYIVYIILCEWYEFNTYCMHVYVYIYVVCCHDYMVCVMCEYVCMMYM